MTTKKKKTAKVPNLRFQGFEGEWEDKMLGEICKMQAGKFVSASEIYEKPQGGLFPCYGGNGLRGYTRSSNYNGKYSLIGRQGALCGNITITDGKFHATEHAVVVTSKDSIDTVWMFYLLTHLNLNQYATGAAQPGLSVQNLEKVEVTIPESKKEQQKISSFLNLIDQRIQTQNKIIEQLETLIKGLCQKLILSQPPNIKLKNCVSCYSSSLTESDVINENGIYPVYGANGIISFIDNHQIDSDSILIIKDGAGVGKVQFGTGKFSVIGTLNYLIAKSDIHLKYIFYALRFFNFEKYKVGSGIPHIYFKDYGESLIFCPSFDEQRNIEQLLSSIDEKINIEKTLLQKYELQKKHLLQNLFI